MTVYLCITFTDVSEELAANMFMDVEKIFFSHYQEDVGS
jgi:hypothetical protein